MVNESDIQQFIQMEAAKERIQLMRNNSGALLDKEGRLVRYGLGNVSQKHNDAIKSSDLIGFTEVVITPQMVGRKIAVFTAVEVKKEGWVFTEGDKRAKAQKAFIDWIQKAGGIAGFAASVTEFKAFVRNWRAGI